MWSFLGWSKKTISPCHDILTEERRNAKIAVSLYEANREALSILEKEESSLKEKALESNLQKAYNCNTRHDLEVALDNFWSTDKLFTLRFIFYIRDCRGGTGQRQKFFWAVNWLAKHPNEKAAALIHNLKHVPFYGRYKDLIEIATDLRNSPFVTAEAYKIYAKQLKTDVKLLGTSNEYKISLAGKYMPSEKKAAGKMLRSFLRCSRKEYRTVYSTPLRKALNIVETKMTNSQKDWDSIDRSQVPTLALKKYKKAWIRHNVPEKARYTGPWYAEYHPNFNGRYSLITLP